MHYKKYTKQRTQSIQGLRSFKDTLPKKIKKIIIKKGEIYSRILENWKYLVGIELFNSCYPKSYKASNKLGKSKLVIMVNRGQEVNVEYSKKNIIHKINSFFGNRVLDTIKLISYEGKSKKLKDEVEKHVTKNKYVKKIASIKNNKIKNSLEELQKVFRAK